MSNERVLNGIVRLEQIYDALLFEEPKHWPEVEDRAGGCVWHARQVIADLEGKLRAKLIPEIDAEIASETEDEPSLCDATVGDYLVAHPAPGAWDRIVADQMRHS